jgi:hypothetical protein
MADAPAIPLHSPEGEALARQLRNTIFAGDRNLMTKDITRKMFKQFDTRFLYIRY